MANYEPLRRNGLDRKKKACIFVAISIAILAVIASVALAMYFWKPQSKAGFINSTNYTDKVSGDDSSVYEVDNNTISFDVSVRLNLASGSKEKRSADCGDAKRDFQSICNGSLSDLQECEQDKLSDFLKKYVNDNFFEVLAARQEAHFSGIKSTEVDIGIFNVKALSIDFKVKITIAYNRTAPSISDQKDSESEIKLQTIVEELKKSFEKCASFLSAKSVKLGLESYRAHESFKLTEGFIGTWKLVSSEKVEELMEHFGVNYFNRKLAMSQKPTVNIAYNDEDNKWTITTSTPLKTQKTVFEVGKEFEELFQDSRKTRSLVTAQNKAFIQTFRDLNGNLLCVITRHLTAEDEQVLTIDASVVVAKRVFQRVK